MDKQTSNKLTEKTTFTTIESKIETETETEIEKNCDRQKKIYIECINSTIGPGCAIDFYLYEQCLTNQKFLKK